MENNQVAIVSQTNVVSIYTDANLFEQAQRVCKMLCASTLVPKEYQNNMSNTLIAYEISIRTGMSPMMVMQNLDVIQGRPTWNSKYVISALNSCGRFSPLQFEYQDLGQKTVNYTATVWNGQNRQKKQESIIIHDVSCVAYATNREGKLIRGPKVSIEMAVKEGWYTKSDSKWPHMPELMLSYRAAKFFGNLYAPDVLMGMMSTDEVHDISSTANPVADGITYKSDAASSAIDKLNELVSPESHSGEAVAEAVIVGVSESPQPNKSQEDDEELV